MNAPLCTAAAMLLLAGLSAATAAPNISSSDAPGRDRQRFLESPVQRFMQPTQQTEPLIQWCDPEKPRAKKQRSKQSRGC